MSEVQSQQAESMAQELKDLRAKITHEAYAMLEAHSRIDGVDISEQARDILHDWAMREIHIASVADSILRSSGNQGICGDAKGKWCERK